MLSDAARFEEEYAMEGLEANTDDDEVETMRERIEWAVAMVEEQRRDAVFLVDYFHTALNEVSTLPTFPLSPSFPAPVLGRFMKTGTKTLTSQLFQLRSIEQNEMAIVADSQNKAVLLFTGVTVVFLPLSFFTSYFGMNLRGVADTDKDENYFWAVCGSIAFLMVLVLVGYAFRRDVGRRVEVEWRARWVPAVKVKAG